MHNLDLNVLMFKHLRKCKSAVVTCLVWGSKKCTLSCHCTKQYIVSNGFVIALSAKFSTCIITIK